MSSRYTLCGGRRAACVSRLPLGECKSVMAGKTARVNSQFPTWKADDIRYCGTRSALVVTRIDRLDRVYYWDLTQAVHWFHPTSRQKTLPSNLNERVAAIQEQRRIKCDTEYIGFTMPFDKFIRPWNHKVCGGSVDPIQEPPISNGVDL